MDSLLKKKDNDRLMLFMTLRILCSYMHLQCEGTESGINVNHLLLTFRSCEVPHDLCPLSICSLSLPHSLHLNPVSGARLEGGQSVGGVTVSRLGDIDGAILGGVGHSEGVALGVAS